MLTQADFVVLTKIDMVSQAELEIIRWQIGALNPALPSSLWTAWRDTAWICSPAGCLPSLNSRT